MPGWEGRCLSLFSVSGGPGGVAGHGFALLSHPWGRQWQAFQHSTCSEVGREPSPWKPGVSAVGTPELNDSLF